VRERLLAVWQRCRIGKASIHSEKGGNLPNRNNIAPQAGAERSENPSGSGCGETNLDCNQLHRLAELVAAGEMNPESAGRGLSHESHQQLETMIRDHLRARLVRFIAM
jgi:hypothetical protein